MNQSAPYIQSQTFFNGARWSAYDRIGELLAQGITQIAIAQEGDDWTVSWPVRHPPKLVPDGVAA